MKSKFGTAALAFGLLIGLAGAANAQAYYGGTYQYQYPYGGYSQYTPYYYYGPGYSWYYGPRYRRATPYGDPYVYWRPYSDGAGPKASGHTGY